MLRRSLVGLTDALCRLAVGRYDQFQHARLLSTSLVRSTTHEKYSKIKARGSEYDESVTGAVNLDDAYEHVQQQREQQASSVAKTKPVKFNHIPDGLTSAQKFNDIKFNDLPVVLIRCANNNTKFTLLSTQNRSRLDYITPAKLGFKNAAKRTNVAAQVTGISVGQALRTMGMRTVRVEIRGFNNGRISGMRGMVSAGINIIAITDTTPIEFNWTRRAKKRRRVN